MNPTGRLHCSMGKKPHGAAEVATFHRTRGHKARTCEPIDCRDETEYPLAFSQTSPNLAEKGQEYNNNTAGRLTLSSRRS